jgi:hypothetical protein
MCLLRGHNYDFVYKQIEEAAKDVATWANAYGMPSLVVHVHANCSRCGDPANTPVQIEGYLIDDRWVAMSEAAGVLTL